MKSGNIKTWLGIFIAALLSWFGISKILEITTDYSRHQQAIANVASIVNENNNINSISSLDALKIHQTKIQQAIEKLKLVPNIPGYPYENAQTKISQLNPLLAYVDSKVKIEDEAASNLQTAQKLDNEAAVLIRNKSYSNNWQEAKSKWQLAISLLEKISDNTYSTSAAKQGLVAVKRNFDDVDNIITNEDKSLKNFTSAVELAHKATELTKDTTSMTLPDLVNAKSQWEQAITLLGNISSLTNLSSKAQSQLTKYRSNYNQVTNAIDNIKKCISENTSSESSCTSSVSLEISPPEILTALLEDIRKEEEAKRIASSESNATSASSSSGTSYYSSGYSSGSSGNSNDSGSSYSGGYSGGYSGSYSHSSGSVYVQGYTRSDGTYVRSHTRSAPGSRVSGFGSYRSGGSSS